jgi:hypothetical protein
MNNPTLHIYVWFLRGYSCHRGQRFHQISNLPKNSENAMVDILRFRQLDKLILGKSFDRRRACEELPLGRPMGLLPHRPRRQGLEGISPRRFRPAAPIVETRVHSIPDLMARKLGHRRPWTRSGFRTSRTAHRRRWVYLCAVSDACSRRVIGWAMDSVPNHRLGRAGAVHGPHPAGLVLTNTYGYSRKRQYSTFH